MLPATTSCGPAMSRGVSGKGSPTSSTSLRSTTSSILGGSKTNRLANPSIIASTSAPASTPDEAACLGLRAFSFTPGLLQLRGCVPLPRATIESHWPRVTFQKRTFRAILETKTQRIIQSVLQSMLQSTRVCTNLYSMLPSIHVCVNSILIPCYSLYLVVIVSFKFNCLEND